MLDRLASSERLCDMLPLWDINWPPSKAVDQTRLAAFVAQRAALHQAADLAALILNVDTIGSPKAP